MHAKVPKNLVNMGPLECNVVRNVICWKTSNWYRKNKSKIFLYDLYKYRIDLGFIILNLELIKKLAKSLMRLLERKG